MPFKGIITALISPFYEGKLDKKSFLKLLKYQTKCGIRQFVLASTTGESPTLEEKEVKSLCKWFKAFESQQAFKLKMILATGSFSTKASIEKTKKAHDLGANGVLVVVPYYNKAPQKGLISHFEQIAKAAKPLPLILYNVPSRTACSLTVDSIHTLSKIKNIVGIKEATGDIKFLKQIQAKVSKKFILLSGDDLSCVPFFNCGGHGAISAGANVLAKELIKLFNSRPAQRAKQWKAYEYFLEQLFKETNPIGLKQVLFETGCINSPELRLPMAYIPNPYFSTIFKKLREEEIKELEQKNIKKSKLLKP